MLNETLAALAAAGGAAVVQNAGTDAWPELRPAVARWFGRGDEQRERAALESLDQTAAVLETAEAAEVEQAGIREEAMWRARIQAALEDMDDAELERAVEGLRELLAQHASGRPGGYAVGGDVRISFDIGRITGGGAVYGVTLGRDGHTSPGPENDPDDDWPQES
ncbi:hypothetical protein [Streptomyces sp. BK340]|uniref:hypothetical protein n=1 Tax=Streptomyces sp. BK340 TaxID=2572903 RepID=UPI0011A3C175|nr:hypothetical protein [Streptomyces sp. BK340]TVZ76869.1 hypothetical protein FB157_1417 [Streptomyces sp. BK340]